ncbi:MAG: anaerobic ribonucleoside-triphosphate reductase activating protein [Bulleidia sp.]|nr:anaerobic ribonucleoside-triphosphate reductase activating protein [Bulleidia sp.]
MYYGTIKKYDSADGEGVRVTLFVSGCTNHCKNCFQPETWNFHYGQEYTQETEKEILEALKPDYIDGLTLLGGEPFEQENQKALLPLLRKVKQTYPDKTIWSYTGFIYDRDLVPNGKRYFDTTDEMVSYLDVLVDGPFVDELKNISLSFRGSENQRVINMQETLKQHRIVLKEVKR